MKRNILHFLSLTGIGAFCTINLQAQVIPLRTTKLSLFNSGLYFHRQEGVAPTRLKTIRIPAPDKAINGTFWVVSDRDNKITQIDIKPDTLKLTKNAFSQEQFLIGNVGSKVTLRLRPDGGFNPNAAERIVTGTIKQVEPMYNLVRLQSESGAINLYQFSDIAEIQLPNNAKTTFMADSIIEAASVRLEKDDAQCGLGVISMENGVNWKPYYLMRLTKDGDAKFFMRANIHNSVRTFENADLELVVGSPFINDLGLEFQLQKLISPPPTAPQPYLRRAKSAVYRGNIPMAMSSDMAAGVEAMSPNIEDNSVEFNGENTQYQIPTNQTEDLIFFKIGKVTLPKNRYTVVPVYTAEVPITHKYALEMFQTGANHYHPLGTPSKFKPTHYLKFVNKTGKPLIGGTVFIMDPQENPLAQSTIPDKPINAETEIALSTMEDCDISSMLTEVKREQNVRKINQGSYDRLFLKETITIKNTSPKSIDLELKQNIVGEVDEKTGVKVIKLGNYNGINVTSQWSTTLAISAGKKTELVIEYSYLIPSGQGY